MNYRNKILTFSNVINYEQLNTNKTKEVATLEKFHQYDLRLSNNHGKQHL